MHAEDTLFRWLINNALRYDLVCIAGDILDMFGPNLGHQQVVRVIKHLKLLQAKVPLTLCLGNHDIDYEKKLRDSLSNESKFSSLLEGASGSFLNRQGNPGLTVTSLPYRASPTHNEKLLGEGKALAEKTGFPWLVLHHEPPARLESRASLSLRENVLDLGGCFFLREAIQQFAPSFILSGHLHQAPYENGFAEKFNSTWCFNPGRLDGAPAASSPNRITLILKEESVAVWEYALPNNEGEDVRNVYLQEKPEEAVG